MIHAGQFATSPPQYWHRVELSDDARFNIHFWWRKKPTVKRAVPREESVTAQRALSGRLRI